MNKELVVIVRFNKIFGIIEYMVFELFGIKDVFVGMMIDLWLFGVMFYEFFKKELLFGIRERGDFFIEIVK